MTMNLIPGIESTGSALTAEKLRLEIIAQNIANSNTTQDASGGVYKRKEVAFEDFRFINASSFRNGYFNDHYTFIITSRFRLR